MTTNIEQLKENYLSINYRGTKEMDKLQAF